MTDIDQLNSIDSESGIIATLIHHPDFCFFSEDLLPNHFTSMSNKIIYTAIQKLAQKGINTVDPYNIIEILSSSEVTRRYVDELSIEQLQDLMNMSDILSRNTIEEYKILVHNVKDAAFRRETYVKLKECQALCMRRDIEDIEKQIYDKIDDVMMSYSTAADIPLYGDVIDECWEEIESRQSAGYSGIPFRFIPALNEYVTMEKGELVIFAAEQKQGKSMMLLNCAIDLLKQDKSVLYIDSELNTRLFTARVIAHLTGIKYRDLVSGAYPREDREKIESAIAWMKTRRFTHIYLPMFDMQSIYSAVKKVSHTQDGLDVLVVDYFKSTSDGDAFDSYQELGRAVDLVKNQIAGDLGIAAIGAAQATATGKVADSAKIGRNASTIILIQDKTAEEIEADGEECGNKKLRVVLNRNGAQMVHGEYLDALFDGDHILYRGAQQHIPESPY